MSNDGLGGLSGGNDTQLTSPADDATRQLSSIPFEALIGGPLVAAVDAQARSAMATVKFVLSALYGEDFFKGDSSQNDGTGVEGVPYKRAGNDTGVIQIELIYSVGNETAKIIVPLITILPIPFIEINNLDIDFTANIKSFETQESKENSTKKWNGESSVDGWWGKYSFDTGIRASSSVSSKSASDLTTEYNMNVSVCLE